MYADANDVTSPIPAPIPASNGHGTPTHTRDPALPGVRVLVRDGDSGPVTGATVTLLDGAGRQIDRGETDDAGRCEFVAFGRGEFLIVVRHAAHLPQAYSVPWPVGATARELEVRLTGAARLEGTVATAAGAPLPDILVTLTEPGGAVIASARTDSAGHYAMVDLIAEVGTLAVFPPNQQPIALPVRLPAGQRLRQDVQVRGAGAVSGVTTTPEGWLIGDARVSLLSETGTELAVTRTDHDGNYRFADVAEGKYTVVAVGYAPASAEILAAGDTVVPPITLGHADAPRAHVPAQH